MKCLLRAWLLCASASSLREQQPVRVDEDRPPEERWVGRLPSSSLSSFLRPVLLATLLHLLLGLLTHRALSVHGGERLPLPLPLWIAQLLALSLGVQAALLPLLRPSLPASSVCSAYFLATLLAHLPSRSLWWSRPWSRLVDPVLYAAASGIVFTHLRP